VAKDLRDSRRRKAEKAMARIDTTLLALTFAAALATGCHHDDASSTAATSTSATSTATTASVTAEDLGKLGAEINKHPHEATKILGEHGMTRQSFETAIRKVSSSPAESKRYAAAYKSAS
jgi:hypothetical protein